MSGKARHYFPGNNTPEGFFSYYHYILSQHEAKKIWCIKGGPGVGKSTFMKKIGKSILSLGYDVDFLHCSSDNSSIDGIVIRDLKISIIDGTKPHIVDPINPAAVDSIINLGDYWNEPAIRKNKFELIRINENIKDLFSRTYNYLAAAEKMYDNVSSIIGKKLKDGELYKIAASLIEEELSHKELTTDIGQLKRFFASAITPTGIENYLDVLTEGYEKVYILQSPIGINCGRILSLVLESALYRGLDVEAFYCSMKPGDKIEHLLIPDLSVAIVTSNKYHMIEPNGKTLIDINALESQELSQTQAHIASDSLERMDDLINRAVECLGEAKKEHDHLESYYIPNMDFSKIELLRREIEESIKKLS
jgi:hypothetical protein